MKVAVSIPDEIFKGAERLVTRNKTSRSRLYSDALREYIARHSPDRVTEAMNQVCDQLDDDTVDPFVAAAARRTLSASGW